MTNSIPIERLRELVEEWQNKVRLNRRMGCEGNLETARIVSRCANQLEALIKEVESKE